MPRDPAHATGMTAFAHTQQRSSLSPTWNWMPHATSFHTTTTASTSIGMGAEPHPRLAGFGLRVTSDRQSVGLELVRGERLQGILRRDALQDPVVRHLVDMVRVAFARPDDRSSLLRPLTRL